jgi:hypothetical protein
MITSDESTVSNRSLNPNVYCFRHAYEKYNRDLVNQTDHVRPTISQMYWAGISLQGRTSLVPMTRDLTSERQGYTAWSYMTALEEGLLPFIKPWDRFQQDNAKIHVARDVIEWLMEYGITLIDWPPNSPDLSPIENIWNILKRKIRRLYPHLKGLKDNRADRAEFKRCVDLAWQAIPQDQIRDLMKSIPDRLRACIRARGWYTKY